MNAALARAARIAQMARPGKALGRRMRKVAKKRWRAVTTAGCRGQRAVRPGCDCRPRTSGGRTHDSAPRASLDRCAERQRRPSGGTFGTAPQSVPEADVMTPWTSSTGSVSGRVVATPSGTRRPGRRRQSSQAPRSRAPRQVAGMTGSEDPCTGAAAVLPCLGMVGAAACRPLLGRLTNPDGYLGPSRQSQTTHGTTTR